MTTSGRRETAAADEIKEAVRRRYAEAARGGSCCGPDLVMPGIGGAAKSGCREDGADGSVQGLRELDLGCGNPLPFAGLAAGETVLDLGSGSGAEVLRSARIVGPTGRAIGVDLTDEMLALARSNQAASGQANVEFLKGDIESLPLPDDSVDVIVSNCVLNLSPDKPAALREAYRVLRPGGRFAVADVVIAGSVEPEPSWRADLPGWTSCVSGAMTESAYSRELEAAGFVDVKLERIATHDGDACCEGGAEGLVVSDLISARKPHAALDHAISQAANSLASGTIASLPELGRAAVPAAGAARRP